MAVERTTWWDLFSIAASGAALAGTIVALRFGATAHRWGPVVAFAALWTLCALYGVVASLALPRRAWKLRSFAGPLDVRLSCPIWIRMRDFFAMVGLGAGVASAVAAIGFPLVAVGVLLPVAGSAVISILPFVPGAVGLTFERVGLRVHLQAEAQFFVPWASVIDVSQTGPVHHRPVNLRVVDPGRTIASVSPDTPRNRGRVQMLFELGEPRREAIALQPWTAGLDGDTLARLVRAATGAHQALAN